MDGRPNRRNKAAFSTLDCVFGVDGTLTYLQSRLFLFLLSETSPPVIPSLYFWCDQQHSSILNWKPENILSNHQRWI